MGGRESKRDEEVGPLSCGCKAEQEGTMRADVSAMNKEEDRVLVVIVVCLLG